MKITFSRIQEIDSLVGRLYAKDPSLKSGKFGYWYNKFVKKNYQPVIDEMAEKILDCQIDNAMVDPETKEVLYTDASQKNYKFDKEGLRKVVEFGRKLQKKYAAMEIEAVPCVSSEVPDGLEDDEKELLRGLLIPNKA